MYCKYHILNMNFAIKKNLCLEERGAEGRLKLPPSPLHSFAAIPNLTSWAGH